jgi:hypothetical protein
VVFKEVMETRQTKLGADRPSTLTNMNKLPLLGETWPVMMTLFSWHRYALNFGNMYLASQTQPMVQATMSSAGNAPPRSHRQRHVDWKDRYCMVGSGQVRPL